MKAIQYFTPEYLEYCQKLTLEQRLQFLEDFRKLNERQGPSKLISLKVPENLLTLFRNKCDLENIKYQTQIKKLMSEWLKHV